jgi:hypothetical protein
MKSCIALLLISLIILIPDFGLSDRGKIVPVTQFTATDAAKGLPSGWKLEKNRGNVFMRLVTIKDSVYLQMASDGHSSFGIKRALSVNLKEYPYLNWTWMAKRLPIGGDIRKANRGDQAAQLYVGLPAIGFPEKLNTPIVGYIWDSEAPKGLETRSPKHLLGKIRYIVIRNKTDHLGQWYTEKRNIYEDYRRLFKDIKGGESQANTQGILLMINSCYTKSSAESLIGNIYFSLT